MNKHLQTYLDQKNFWQNLTNKPEYKLPLSREQIRDLLGDIDGELSPENLCCDGELSHTQVMKKKRMLDGAKEALIQHYLITNNRMPSSRRDVESST